ncbi:MAG TPA: hypothetical protein VIK06_01055 [Candidatus Limnocylindrales bacterium]
MSAYRTSKPASTADDMIKIAAEPDVEIPTEATAEPTVPAEEPAQADKPKAAPAPRTASGGHPFRHHEVPMGDGKLVLDREGSIRSIAADGSVTAAWEPDDPEWDRYAIRFGLRPGGAGGSSVPGHPPQRARRPRS